MTDVAGIVRFCPPINTCMRFYEFAPVKPLTPAQGRIASLKRQVEVAKKALAHERKLQAQQKIQQRMQKLAAQKV
jgi:hypothetical protein